MEFMEFQKYEEFEDNSYESIMSLPDDNSFATYFSKLHAEDLYQDAEFDLLGPEGPVTLKAHTLIMSLWSPYFANKFYSGEKKLREKKKMGVITLQYNDVNPEVFEAMLEFMYGKFPQLVDDKKVCELYTIAGRFEVNGLLESCRQFLNRIEVEPSNVFTMLDYSEKMRNKSRTDTCMNLLQERTKEVMEAYDLSAVSSAMLKTLLDQPKMSLTGEYDLLLWVFAWGKYRVLEDAENSDSRSIRRVLTPYLPKLNFLSLTCVEFATLVKNNEGFFNQDEIISIFMNIGVRGSRRMPEWFDESRPARVYL